MLKAPFPWFGGKSRCADLIWQHFGDVPNYVEPFLGSAAVLLARPHAPRTETVNDRDCYLANFWRAVQYDPEAVAYFANGPVNEADLHARHLWLVEQADFREQMMRDPLYFDAQIAGWWVWGISQWIGSGWCSKPEWAGRTNAGRAPRGVNSAEWRSRPNLTRTRDIGNSENWKKRPALHRGGRGVNSRMGNWKTRPFLSNGNGQGITTIAKRPNLSGGHGGFGIHAKRLARQIPDISGRDGASGRGIHAGGFKKMPVMKRSLGAGVLRTEYKRPGLTHRAGMMREDFSRARPMKVIAQNLLEFMLALQDRLRCVRVCCGDWKRILGPSPTTCIGLTGVFLDPPYSREADRDPSIYNVEDLDVAHEVRKWAIKNGDDSKLRIALCGYEGEHKMPRGWTKVAWKANGGYGNQTNGRGRENAHRERIWFSPYCLKPEDMLL